MYSEAATSPEASQTSSRRVASKSNRRSRIIAAADAILRSTDGETLTIAAVAARADVCPATVYNLFGSKSALLAEVSTNDVQRYEAAVWASPEPDALARLLGSIRIAANFFRSAPEFYRDGRWTRAKRIDDRAAYMAKGAPRLDLPHELVKQAMLEGDLEAGADWQAIGNLLSQIGSGTLADLSWGRLDIDGWEVEMQFGYASVLYTFATVHVRTRLIPLISRGKHSVEGA
jgi:AcrR family transcriptional regulator